MLFPSLLTAALAASAAVAIPVDDSRQSDPGFARRAQVAPTPEPAGGVAAAKREPFPAPTPTVKLQARQDEPFPTSLLPLPPALGTSAGAGIPSNIDDAPATNVIESVAEAAATGAYFLNQANRGSSFFSNDNWDFYTGPDPTHGSVKFLTEEQAQSEGLIGIENNQAFMRMNSDNLPLGEFRKSVRFNSKRTWDSGLIIFDVAKMPVGCGTWPALWTLGPNWPSNGEIDVMEGIGNTAAGTNANLVSVHLNRTSPIDTNRALYRGSEIVSDDCDTNYGLGNTGCSYRDDNSRGPSWGPDFNAAGGGIWALQFGKGDGIKVWFWGRDRAPLELRAPGALGISPPLLTPFLWGTPMANFQNDFINRQVLFQRIIMDITLGGDWAGNLPMDGNCPATDYEGAFANGDNYKDAEFILNAIDVYCSGGPDGC